jgi:hypothetical protein
MISLIRRRLSQAQSLGPRTAIRLAISRAARIARARIESSRALLLPTGMHSWRRERIPWRILPALRMKDAISLEHFERGTFDLLASGPRTIHRPFDLCDLPKAWRARAGELGPLAVATLASIDWQLDPTSGHRWDARMRSSSIAYGDDPGVEVKWPWEIGRLQHLPAIAARIEGADPAWRTRAADLIRGHVIDFVRSNPPGFGVQWLCPMDVGIRIANILVAVDLARAAGQRFDPDFLKVVACTARDHARHIARNLEWGERLCSNHYLANIAGLLYAGAYLGDDPEAQEWVVFAGREWIVQLKSQFHADGSNFEASTCYHRLSGEMAVHCACLMLWISARRPELATRWWSGPARCFHPAPEAPATPAVEWHDGILHPFDSEAVRRLSGIGEFVADMLRGDGSIPQIGDNDSGRFLRLSMGDDPAGDVCSYRHLVEVTDALFGRPAAFDSAEHAWVTRWLEGRNLTTTCSPRAGRWPEFGLFIWRRPRIEATFRCGHVGQRGNGGHAHCDQLSVTLCVDGVAFIDDPGSGVYTPNPEVRNSLRSSQHHSTVMVAGAEQGSWLAGRWGLFAMRDLAQASILAASDCGAAGKICLGGQSVERTIEVSDVEVRIIDLAPEGAVCSFVLAPGTDAVPLDGNTLLLRRHGVEVRMVAQSATLLDCPWSDRYGALSVTRSVRCKPGIVRFQVSNQPSTGYPRKPARFEC